MPDVVIAGFARAPFHPASKGALAKVRPDDLAAQVVKALVERTGVDPAKIEDLVLGCAFPEGEQGFNIARLVVLLAGLPTSVGGITMNRFCGSSMSAVHYAAGQIALGAGECFVCGGVESMSRVPMGGFNPMPNPQLAKSSQAYIAMGDTAENLAAKYQIDRARQEAFALASQQKAAAARQAGKFKDEIVPITVGGETVSEDGTIRADTTAEGLAGLKPAFIELNEAFGSQALAVLHDLGADESKVNLDGGAIALGHPLGASGARILGKAASLLKREGRKYALATMCIGGGQGVATVLEAAE